VKAFERAILPEIEEIVEQGGGRVLRNTPDALGIVPVESTPAGIRGLAKLDSVRAILEDQSLMHAF
jgi:hypothetical protein